MEKKDLLYRIFVPEKTGNEAKQLVVPWELQHKVISMAHDGLLSEHCGIKRTKERVLSNFYWEDVDTDIKRNEYRGVLCTVGIGGKQKNTSDRLETELKDTLDLTLFCLITFH